MKRIRVVEIVAKSDEYDYYSSSESVAALLPVSSDWLEVSDKEYSDLESYVREKNLHYRKWVIVEYLPLERTIDLLMKAKEFVAAKEKKRIKREEQYVARQEKAANISKEKKIATLQKKLKELGHE